MRAACAISLAAILAGNAVAADESLWQNLAASSRRRRSKIVTKSDQMKVEFIRFDDQGITVRDKKGERTLAQPDVKRVRLARRNRGIWIGVAAGGAGGAVVGVAIGERAASDFNNLKPAIAAVSAGIGMLTGAIIGTAVRRSPTIYRKR